MDVLLNKIVSLLTDYVEDAVLVPESEILLFVQDRNIQLREDHLRFLMRFGCEPGELLRVFRECDGDFDFEYFKSFYVEDEPGMRVPDGNVYFGTVFPGDSLCIDFESGKIYAYDDGDRYGIVYESVDGFLLGCLISVYADKAFSGKVVKLDMEYDCFNGFRMENESNKIVAANANQIEYVHIDNPVVIAEYYWVDNKLIALYPTSQSMVAYSGGILENINA